MENCMSKLHKIFSTLALLALFTLLFATPARAFDGRSGDTVVVQADEVINDDLYVGANEFVLDGTVNGDVIAFAKTITINGKVTGDLMAAGQTVVINGSVAGDVRAAGSVLFLGETASVGGDVVSAGYSLEVQKGGAVGRDLVFAGGQILLAGDVTRDVSAATAAFEIRGDVGGDVQAEVGEPDQGRAGPPPMAFMPEAPVRPPTVKPGLTIDPSAKIAGNLEYTQTQELTFPPGVVAGTITRTEPPADRDRSRPSLPKTPSEKIANWALNLVRTLATLILIGLFLLWLFPAFVNGLTDELQAKPWPSLAWGVVAWAAFLFSLLLIACVVILGALLFGVLTLRGLSGTIVWLGFVAVLALIVAFVLMAAFVAKIVFGIAIGKWILAQAKSPLLEHKYWPMVIGVAITAIAIALLSFPLIPGLLGGLASLAIVFFGLGALWLWGRERLARKPSAPAA
jgi:cytoskeletal protein CcmA (bactofilin family)